MQLTHFIRNICHQIISYENFLKKGSRNIDINNLNCHNNYDIDIVYYVCVYFWKAEKMINNDIEINFVY